MRKMWRVLLMAPALSGCGVAEYEAELRKTQERLAHVDRERELLGGPIEWPRDSPRIHFRPPAGFAAKADRGEDFEGGRWLHFPWQAGPAPTAFDLFVGVPPKDGGKPIEDWIKDYLKTQGADDLEPRAASRDERLVRQSEPPDRRQPFEVRRLALRGEERPRLAEGPLPESVFAQYDLYLFPARDTRLVVVFKQFDRKATQERWRGKDLRPLRAILPSAAQEKQMAEALAYSIATLKGE